MKNDQEEWYFDSLDIIDEVERMTVKSEEFLDATNQLDEVINELMKLIPDSKNPETVKLLNKAEECRMTQYNIIMKNVVCAIKFEDFEI